MHNLDVKTDGKFAFVSRKEHAWHQLGTVLDVVTWENVLDEGGLDYEVKKDHLYRIPSNVDDVLDAMQRDGRKITKKDLVEILYLVKGKYATFRVDRPKDTFGVVGETYRIFQNKELKIILEALSDEGGVTYETAGVIDGGKKAWILAKMPESLKVLGQDEVNSYLLLSQGFDGLMTLQITYTPIRVVCQNTLTVALKGAKTSYALKHTESLRAQIHEVAKALKKVNDVKARLGEIFDAMAKYKFSLSDYKNYYQVVLPVKENLKRERKEKPHDNWIYLAEHGMGTDIPFAKETLWGAYNSVVEGIDFGPKTMRKNRDARINYTVYGLGADLKAHALETATMVLDKGTTYLEDIIYKQKKDAFIENAAQILN